MYAERPSRLIPGAVLWTARHAAVDGWVLPDGCMDLVRTDGTLLVAGPDTRPHRAGLAGPGTVVGIRLPPGAAPVVLGVPALELRDACTALEDVWGARRAAAWSDRLDEADVATARADVAADLPRGEADPPESADLTGRSTPATLEALELLLAQALAAQGDRPDEVRATVALVRAGHGATQVADRLGVTTRTLHRWSLDSFGYGPRILGRVLRLQRAVALLGAGHPPVDVAHRAGYADQPHLSREVRALTGSTPSALAGPPRPGP